MPYRKSVFAQGCYYHVFNRGANRENIFRTEKAMVKNPEDWRYSNYLEIRSENGLSFRPCAGIPCFCAGTREIPAYAGMTC